LLTDIGTDLLKTISSSQAAYTNGHPDATMLSIWVSWELQNLGQVYFSQTPCQHLESIVALQP